MNWQQMAAKGHPLQTVLGGTPTVYHLYSRFRVLQEAGLHHLGENCRGQMGKMLEARPSAFLFGLWEGRQR